MLYKKCAYHHKVFPEENEWFPCTNEYFYINKKNSKDGLYPECKRCSSKRAYNRENIDKEGAKEYKHKYYIDNKEKRLTSFKKRYNIKKDEWKIYYSNYLKNNPDKINQYSAFRRQHKIHNITKKEWDECKKYFNNSCAYCGLPVEDHYRMYAGKLQKIDLHKEHVNHEGDNNLSNCVPSCQICNSEKHKKTLDEFYNSNNSNFTLERYNKIIQWINKDYKYIIR